jgi:hypothetical protein
MGFPFSTHRCEKQRDARVTYLAGRRAFTVGFCLGLPLALAGCGGDDAPPAEAYTPLHYDFLPKLRLNVGSIVVENHAQPLGQQDIAASSPAVPAEALAQMAHDRLFAAGFSGAATFVIDQASILRAPNGALDGVMAVHMTITEPGGAPGGYAAASVQRQHVPGSDPENEQNNLYDLTKLMMDAMNVEFEFQLRKSLSSWLVTGEPVPTPVQAQPLTPAAPPQPSNAYQDPLAPPPAPPAPEMSPPPGYLQAPPGVAPSTGY